MVVAIMTLVATAVSPAGAQPASPASDAPSSTQAAPRSHQPCKLYGSENEGYWSRCFPVLHMNISWNGDLFNGQDTGREVGTQAVDFFVEKNETYAFSGQSSSLHDRATITGTLTDPDCGAAARPSYHGHGNGTLEGNDSDDSFPMFSGGEPVRTYADWEPNVKPYTVSYPDCNGDSYPVQYSPGTPEAGYKCDHDPRRHAEYQLYYGTYSSIGTVANGVEDKWNFTCSFIPQDSWTSTGDFTATELPCDRDAAAAEYGQLSAAMKAALKRFYRGLRYEGGCYEFLDVRSRGRAQPPTVNIDFGSRPLGSAVFATTEKLREYIVPVVHRIAKSAGLCGPTAMNPNFLQQPYKKGKEKTATCHLP